MPYNEYLADRVRNSLKETKTGFEEKKMFGGICFLVDDKMCVGIIKEELMVRVDPALQEILLAHENCRPMDFTKQSMKGFLFVQPEGVDMDEDLDKWIELCLEFNPNAKSSKKKK